MVSEESKKIMAKNILRCMEQKGVTRQQVCDDLGFKYTTFRDWVKGITYPRIGKVEAMADYFGVMKSDLIEEKTEEWFSEQQKNNVLADVVIRMRTDEAFFNAVSTLYELDANKLDGLIALLK